MNHQLSARTLISPRWIVVLGVIAGALIMSAALGVRQTFGLFINPFSYDHGIPLTSVAFAIALHNLVWGIGQPFAGAAVDRYGPTPVVAFGAIAYAVGLFISAVSPSGPYLILGMGIFVGVGISCTSFGVVLAAVGRLATDEKRSMAMGLSSAGGSIGQVLLVPLAQWVSEQSGAALSLFVLAGCLLAIAPLGILLEPRRLVPVNSPHETATSLLEIVWRALSHPGYQLLTIGFFACGFQLAFIGTHLPGYLALCHLPIGLGVTALALIGFFNMIGSWGCGWLGGRYRQHLVLGWLYLVRASAIAAFFWFPKTEASVIIFAIVIGLAWLGAVPLTTGLIARLFGVQNLGALFGVCFLNHQIGSFLGAWLGGYLLDTTGSYSLVWAAAATAGFIASLLHFLIDDRVDQHPAGNTESARLAHVR